MRRGAGKAADVLHAARARYRQGRHVGVRLLSLWRANAETGRSGGVERGGRSRIVRRKDERTLYWRGSRGAAERVRSRARRHGSKLSNATDRVARRTCPKKKLSTTVLVRQSARTAGAAMATRANARSISVTRMLASLCLASRARGNRFLGFSPTDREGSCEGSRRNRCRSDPSLRCGSLTMTGRVWVYSPRLRQPETPRQIRVFSRVP